MNSYTITFTFTTTTTATTTTTTILLFCRSSILPERKDGDDDNEEDDDGDELVKDSAAESLKVMKTDLRYVALMRTLSEIC